ncbi:MAG: PTS sugar transporter subunit IIA [Planctomycetes bacterium]|nr:PTS sugar transporter subunit IIA [Planctomycetota bacterium]
MKLLRQALEQGSCILREEATDIQSVFRDVLALVVERGLLAAEDQQQVLSVLSERERLSSTAIGHAVAVPHAYLSCFKQQVIVPVRLTHAINLGAPDGIPTQFIFVLMGPDDGTVDHVDTLMHIARLMADDEFRYEAGEAKSSQEMLAALDRFLVRTALKPPAEKPEVVDGLTYTGRLFGGIRADIARRLPHYWSDFRDGLHSKCVGSTLFLFFACLAPAVTFGGVLAVATDGDLGAVEMIAATAFCGIIYAFVSGQPLVILGGTGPLLVFTVILYELCVALQIDFLPARGWVGLWTMLFVIVMAATDSSCLIRFFTRFTDETFSALISLIFIYQAVLALVEIFQNLDEGLHHDTALLSLLLALGTFYIAMSLSRFRRSSYLLPWMREFLADFGPTIAIGAMTLVAISLKEVFLDVLPAPEEFGTTTGRPWLVDMWATPMWVRWASAGPALLVALLVYLDQNITARLVNSPDHKLKKGEAYHLDLLVVGGLIGICSLFGLPWLLAATVRSLNHVRSLATSEEVVFPSGQRRERVIHVRENRVTSLTIHVLIGLSLLLLPWLKVIPMAVLYGLFLFMGVVSMAGNQFFERLSLWLKEPTLYPATHYVRRVPTWTIHKFTLLQAVCLAVLWAVKGSFMGILFPLFIALLVPVRFVAGRFFAEKHLAVLDAEEEPEEEASAWI